jgi:sortase A
MSKYYVKHNKNFTRRKAARFIGLLIAVFGFVNLIYFFFPLISWQLFFAPAFAQQNVVAPVPVSSRLNLGTLGSLFSTTVNSLSGVDYTDARNWFPDYNIVGASPNVRTYTLSIPKLGIHDAEVTTVDNDLKQHLVNYAGTAVPPEKGNAVIYGHSTLPHLFNQKDYTAIFATLHTIKTNDTIEVSVRNTGYTYRVTKVTVVDAEDSSVLAQDFNDSYLTLITCTPPGTIWKRLIVKAVREKI